MAKNTATPAFLSHHALQILWYFHVYIFCLQWNKTSKCLWYMTVCHRRFNKLIIMAVMLVSLPRCLACALCPHICYCRHVKSRSWSRSPGTMRAPSPLSSTWSLTGRSDGSLNRRSMLAGSSKSSTQTSWELEPWMEGWKNNGSSLSFRSDGESQSSGISSSQSSQSNILVWILFGTWRLHYTKWKTWEGLLCLSHLVQWQKPMSLCQILLLQKCVDMNHTGMCFF